MGTKKMDNELFSPEEMQSPFEAIKETDAEGREWWNSRKLAQIDAMVDINNFDNSYEATQFRIWARGVLKEYMMHKDNELNLLTASFLGIAERRARRHVLTTMTDWKELLINKTI